MRLVSCLLAIALAGCSRHREAAQVPASHVAAHADPLPSWNDGPTKRAIVSFVERTTRPDSPDRLPLDERIAVFDNDGTLWAEKPLPVEVAFELDTAPDLGTTEAFGREVTRWLATATDRRFHRHYTELVYEPMLEVLAYMRANGFKTYLVSGGGIEFMRPWTERVYGIPPEQVIGTRPAMAYEVRDTMPEIIRLPKVEFGVDHANKPIAIEQVIGRRPVAAFGNSDGDLEMLEWTTSAPGARLGVLVHHTDGVREYAYDRIALSGRLSRALDEAPQRGWVVADMKTDWKVVYPFESR